MSRADIIAFFERQEDFTCHEVVADQQWHICPETDRNLDLALDEAGYSAAAHEYHGYNGEEDVWLSCPCPVPNLRTKTDCVALAEWLRHEQDATTAEEKNNA